MKARTIIPQAMATLLVALPICFITSCSNGEEALVPEDSAEVKITATVDSGMNSRTDGATGSIAYTPRVGELTLFANELGADKKATYAYSSKNSKWIRISHIPLKWSECTSNDNNNYIFYAVAPAVPAGMSGKVHLDQSTQDLYDESDLLAARVEFPTPATTPSPTEEEGSEGNNNNNSWVVPIELSHLMSCLVIQLSEQQDNVTGIDLSNAKVTVGGLKYEYTLNAANESDPVATVKVNGTIATSMMPLNTGNSTYSLLFPAQEVLPSQNEPTPIDESAQPTSTPLSIKVEVEGFVFTCEYTSPLTFSAGKKKLCTLTVNVGNKDTGITATIADWNDVEGSGDMKPEL